MIYLAWKVLGCSQSFSLVGKVCLSKIIFISQFKLWAVAALQISASLYEGPIYLLLSNFCFYWVSIFSDKAPTREHYCHTCALDVANIWLYFMNGSMIEHNGLLIAFFSIDILKDMVACWYAWVLMSSCQIIDYYFESFKSKCPCYKRKEYEMTC